MENRMSSSSVIEQSSNNHKKLLNLFDSPKLIGIVGDANSGKTNLIVWILESLMKSNTFDLYTFGLRVNIVNEKKLHSVEQLESITNSLIVVDEFPTMIDIENRKQKKEIESTLRLIFHNNNILVLCSVPESYKKFVASKLDAVIFKKCALGDLINGSRVKTLATNYSGYEKGAAVLNVPNNMALLYDGSFYYKVQIPYIKSGDTKAENAPILQSKVEETGKRNEKRS